MLSFIRWAQQWNATLFFPANFQAKISCSLSHFVECYSNTFIWHSPITISIEKEELENKKFIPKPTAVGTLLQFNEKMKARQLNCFQLKPTESANRKTMASELSVVGCCKQTNNDHNNPLIQFISVIIFSLNLFLCLCAASQSKWNQFYLFDAWKLPLSVW